MTPTCSTMRRLGAAALLLLTAPAADAQDRRLTIRPAPGVPAGTPILLPAPDDLDPGLYALRSSPDSPPIDGVVVADGPIKTFAFIAPELADPTTFLVSLSARALDEGEGVTFAPDGPNLKILAGGLLGVHRVDGPYKPFLFPLIGPTGKPMTRSYPMEQVAGEDVDHPHQSSFWFTHGRVNDVDFWTVKKGTIRETEREVVASGPVLGRLKTADDWLAPDGAKVCEDERVLTAYDTKDVRILDFEVTLKATAGPVVLGETKEGSFGVRVASSMDVDRKTGGKIRNAEGLEDADAWGKPSSWVDYSGPIAGETLGIAILNHPTSFRYPTTWHVRTYGLFAANPFGGPEFKVDGYAEHRLAKDESIRLAYRVVLHKGDATAIDLPRRFALYAAPPESSWEEGE
ncbi:MAG: hypothetical protein BGO49_14280 [Planctomycetales bacterium 71-10]|nr:MAG: hypothetical protein BGO49_14280 [Planctomycetales bacterium 71-10]